jgi:hypothetical protein
VSQYGVQPTGFVRKPLGVILRELQNAFVTEFGPQVITTSESPAGQLIGTMADAIAEEWERAQNTYQSYDVDQAEGFRLDQLGRYRLVERASDSDQAYRQRITNEGEARVDVQDITNALLNVAGVTYARVWVNGNNEVDENGLPAGAIAIAVMGGEDDEIAAEARSYVAPGIVTFGNAMVDTVVSGFCRSLNIIRPIVVPVTLSISVRLFNDAQNCPPPAPIAIANGLAEDWAAFRSNGDDVNYFKVRQYIESRHQGVEVLSISAARANDLAIVGGSIGFIEIADLSADNITVTVA